MSRYTASSGEPGKLSTPDITPAQVIAVVGSVLAVIVAAGLDISQELQDSIIRLVTVLAPLLLGADALIRHGRSRAFLNPPKAIESEGDSGVKRVGGA